MTDILRHLDLRTILHSVVDGVTIASADGTMVFSNRAADEILGAAVTDAAPARWAEHYGVFLPGGATPFPADQYPLVRALKGEETRDVEMWIRNANRPDGAIIAVSGGPILSSSSQVIGALVVFRDITALRRAERVKEELHAFFMHDLKSPLTAILSLAQLARADAANVAESLRADLEGIEDSAVAMKRMVLNFLDVHLGEDGALEAELEPLRVADLLRLAYEDMAPRARAMSTELLPPEASADLVVLADQELALRILQNLIDNCLKYGLSGGRIWLDARQGDPGRVVISVRDEGPGVPEEWKVRIFDKYAASERDAHSRKHGSRGLGLRFCTIAAEAHGGRIWVEDNDPVGVIFNLEMPATGG